MVKGREAETPIFAHANARNTLFACQTLKGFDVDTEVFRCFFCGQKRLKEACGFGADNFKNARYGRDGCCGFQMVS